MIKVKQIASILTRTLVVDRNVRRLRATDVFISSYPRSGNTWMRHLICDALLQAHGLPFEPGSGFPIHPNRIIPDIYVQDIRDIDPRVRLPFRLIKTHEYFSDVVKNAVYVFRAPEDALISHYHFHLRYERLRSKAPMGPDLFCLEKLSQWYRNVDSYIQGRQANKARLLFVSYESMHQHPVEILQAVMGFLGIPADREICHKAVENHTFNKKRTEEHLGEQHHEHFFRKGRIGSGREELCVETVEAIRAIAGPLYEMASSLEEN